MGPTKGKHIPSHRKNPNQTTLIFNPRIDKCIFKKLKEMNQPFIEIV